MCARKSTERNGEERRRGSAARSWQDEERRGSCPFNDGRTSESARRTSGRGRAAGAQMRYNHALRFGPNGRPIQGLRTAWEGACRAAGCSGRVSHDLRRSAVREFIRKGIPERVAMLLTGHKTQRVFERDNIVRDGDLKAATAKLDGWTGTISGTTGSEARSSGN
jgi:integrase